VIERPQYQRLCIGTIQGEESRLLGRVLGEVSNVPYAEPTWLEEGYYSPYYTDVSREPYFRPLSCSSRYRIIGNSKRQCVGSSMRLFILMPRCVFIQVLWSSKLNPTVLGPGRGWKTPKSGRHQKDGVNAYFFRVSSHSYRIFLAS
jgi:hypothetical protein